MQKQLEEPLELVELVETAEGEAKAPTHLSQKPFPPFQAGQDLCPVETFTYLSETWLSFSKKKEV